MKVIAINKKVRDVKNPGILKAIERFKCWGDLYYEMKVISIEKKEEGDEDYG